MNQLRLSSFETGLAGGLVLAKLVPSSAGGPQIREGEQVGMIAQVAEQKAGPGGVCELSVPHQSGNPEAGWSGSASLAKN